MTPSNSLHKPATLIPMIARLHGTIAKTVPGELIVDVGGVGYRVHVPLPVWEKTAQGAQTTLSIASYIREDRFDLFGFTGENDRRLFEELIAQPGIGPKLALELCSVSHDLLLTAIAKQDPDMLTDIKGIGKKKAEKLLIELKSLLEKHPEMLSAGKGIIGAGIDRDAMDALGSLGYDSSTIIRVLRSLPSDLATTEERVTAALRSL